MREIVEFDFVHEYSLYEIGIVVDVILTTADKEIRINARVDTGSTYCLFERRFGEELGLVVEIGFPVQIGTATGSFRAYGHEIEVDVLGVRLHSTVYFAESEQFDRNVLGRSGWLNKVKLGLIEPEGKLYLSRYEK
ncbi:hypothetical protein BH10ACI2_BH10ACI2_19120 [soil metagenome]